MKTLTPAYGRDYRYATQARQAYQDNLDFILQDITSRWDGKPVNREQLNGEAVVLRYNSLRQTTVTA